MIKKDKGGADGSESSGMAKTVRDILLLAILVFFWVGIIVYTNYFMEEEEVTEKVLDPYGKHHPYVEEGDF